MANDADNKTINKSDFIVLDLTKQGMLYALKKSLKMGFTDNLRERDDVTRLDSTVRGLAAQIGIRAYLKSNGIGVAPYNDEMRPAGDTDITVNGRYGDTTIEVKSSLLPEYLGGRDMDLLEKADIKIIARRGTIEEDISRDIYIQTYFDMSLKEREDYLEWVELSDADTVETIYRKLNLDTLINSCMFTAWTTARMENDYLESLDPANRQWGYGYRQFWRSPLSLAYKPADLVPYLRLL